MFDVFVLGRFFSGRFIGGFWFFTYVLRVIFRGGICEKRFRYSAFLLFTFGYRLYFRFFFRVFWITFRWRYEKWSGGFRGVNIRGSFIRFCSRTFFCFFGYRRGYEEREGFLGGDRLVRMFAFLLFGVRVLFVFFS